MKQPRLYILVFFLDCCYIVFDWLVSNLFPHHHSIASHVPLAFLLYYFFCVNGQLHDQCMLWLFSVNACLLLLFHEFCLASALGIVQGSTNICVFF